MSSSVGYSYSYVDVEAQRQRELRVEITQLRQRLAVLREQVAAVSVTGRRRTMIRRSAVAESRTSATSAELQAAATTLAAEVAEAQRQVDAALDRRWATRIAATTSAPAAPAATAPGVAQRAAARAPTEAGRPAELAEVRASALAEARQLVTENASRCDTADLDSFESLLAELAAASTVSVARDRLFEINSLVRDSIGRRGTVERFELERARLLALVEDAPEDEREQLRTAVTVAYDPSALADRVLTAVWRADRAKARVAVIEATRAAMAEIGCEVGEEFGTRLAAGERGLAAFSHPEGAGYGLLVSVPDGSAQLTAAVVRRADLEPDPQRDRQVQQHFCETQLDKAEQRLRTHGISLQLTARLQPGQQAPRPVDPDSWPRRRAAGETKDGRSRTQPARRRRATEQARERHT